jgi:membrane protein implicated in regulation of membrane protease activity
MEPRSRRRHACHMTIGASLFMIALGAILAFAVTAEFAGIDIQIVGYILLVIGVVGLVLGLVFLRRDRPTGAY